MRDAQRAEGIDFELPAHRVDVEIRERRALQDAGVVDQQVDGVGFDRLRKRFEWE